MDIGGEYDKEKPPMKKVEHKGVTTFHNTPVEASVQVTEIFDIDEEKSIISLLLRLTLKWYDWRVTFNFLKDDQENNIIEETEAENIWMPTVKFSFLQNDLKEQEKVITVEKNGKGKLVGKTWGIDIEMDSLHPTESYSGTQNAIHMMTEYQNLFNCRFENIHDYPFDREGCKINIQCSGSKCPQVDIHPSQLRIIPTSFGQYEILTNLSTLTWKKTNFLAIEIKFGRNYLSIFQVTYLPTILMNIINQATNYINATGKYEFIITVNITCMMVLSSIYLSVSTSLPTTAAIKPVEIWLLFNLAYPFLVIMINIIVQVSIRKTKGNADNSIK